MDDIAIKVGGVYKSFKLPHEKTNSLKGAFVNVLRAKRTYETQKVLKDVSFEIKKGEFFGIVGRNGSGKSTLLKLLACIYAPDKGEITVKGKLTPFIELGVGFNPELTGRENVFLNGALLGFSRKEMAALYDGIVEFAELEKFMDQKLKNYSSGMQVRLAFSIAIKADSDILLLDEVLAVGDVLFQKKCFSYFKELKSNKKTVVFISHDIGALREYCTNGVLIDKGKVIVGSNIDTVVNEYLDIMNKSKDYTPEETDTVKKRWGTGDAKVLSVNTRDSRSFRDKSIFTEQESICIDIKYIAEKNLDNPIYGLVITDEVGNKVIESNTKLLNIKTDELIGGKERVVRWVLPNTFNNGVLKISPAIADSTGLTIFDWRDDFLKFRVKKNVSTGGIMNTPHTIKIMK